MFLFKCFNRNSNKKDDIKNAFESPCRSGNLKLLKKLVLDKKKDVNTYNDSGYTPLQYTLINKKYDCTVFLLEHGANPNAYCRNPIMPSTKIMQPCIRANNLSDIRLLTVYGANSKGVGFIAHSEAETCFNTTRQVYEQIKPLEDELKRLLKTPDEEQAVAECSTRLVQLWQEMEEAEKQNQIYKNHYKQKVSLYKQIAREPASFMLEYQKDIGSDAERPLLTPSSP